MRRPDRIKRVLLDAGKRGMRRLFEVAQRAGVNVLPRHFYSEIPFIADLREDETWRRPHSMVGIRGAETPKQLSFVRACCPPELVAQVGAIRLYDDACEANGAVGYGPIESEFLYCFIATRRPARVIQIGCGVSTAVMLRAYKDIGRRVELICIDPYPTRYLAECAQRGDITLIQNKAQNVPLELLTGLSEGDLLFVDSTHTVKPGSEVNLIVLEVLPRLAPGVYVHFHDICFPYDYIPEILQSGLFFWNESVLVQAFLTGNRRYRLRVAMSLLHHADPAGLQEILPAYRPWHCRDGLRQPGDDGSHFPSAAYLEVAEATD